MPDAANTTASSAATKTVALFGGSFNPPHIAHSMVMLYVLETQAVDEVWMMPTWRHPFGKELTSFDQRVAMCEIAAAALGPRVKVSRVEADLAAGANFVASRTLDTIAVLQATFPSTTFRLLVGADILSETDKWHRWDDVVRAAPLIVLGRTGHVLPQAATATGVVMPEISSTVVRNRLLAGDAVDGLVARSVIRYIEDHGLYRDQRDIPSGKDT